MRWSWWRRMRRRPYAPLGQARLNLFRARRALRVSWICAESLSDDPLDSGSSAFMVEAGAQRADVLLERLRLLLTCELELEVVHVDFRCAISSRKRRSRSRRRSTRATRSAARRESSVFLPAQGLDLPSGREVHPSHGEGRVRRFQHSVADVLRADASRGSAISRNSSFPTSASVRT